MHSSKIIFIGLLFTLIVGCGEDSVSSGISEMFYPLKVDNYWKYAESFYDSSGNIERTGERIYVVDSDTSINSETWYSITINHEQTYRKTFYTNRDSGYCISYDTGKTSFVYFKHPVIINDIYVQHVDTTKVIALQQLIQTKVGNFHCVAYRRTSSRYIKSAYVIDYVSPGYGLIKYEAYLERDSLTPLLLYAEELIELKIR